MVAVVAVAALVAVACGGGDTIVHTGSSAVTGISVSGTGRATAEPDLVLLQLGIEVERSTVTAAREDAAASQQAIVDALKATGVDEDDIQTVQFSVWTRYDYSSDNERVLRGYNVSNVVSITLRGVDGAPAGLAPQDLQAVAAAFGRGLIAPAPAVGDPRGSMLASAPWAPTAGRSPLCGSRHNTGDFSTDVASYSGAVDFPAATASKISRTRPSNAISWKSGSFM